MPLLPGTSDEVIAANIAELIASGYEPGVARAIALHHAYPDRRDDSAAIDRLSRAKVQLAQRRAVLPTSRKGGRFVPGHSAPRRMPRPAEPTAITASYGAQLRRLVGELGNLIKPAIAHAAAGDAAATQHAIERAARMLEHHTEAARAPERLAQIARQASRFQEAQFDRQVKARLGTPLYVGDAGHGAIERRFVARNRQLIDSLGSRAHEQIAGVLHAGMGKSEDELRALVEERLDVARSRADIIASDQIGKADAAYADARISALGVGWIWRHRKPYGPNDRQEHIDLDGERFSEDDPPDDMPGELIGCACYQEPALDELTRS